MCTTCPKLANRQCVNSVQIFIRQAIDDGFPEFGDFGGYDDDANDHDNGG